MRGVRQINDIDNHLGTTILHTACYADFAELLEPLFWRGACFDALDRFGGTPLNAAILSGDIDIVRFALALGSDPNLEWPLLGAFSAERHDLITLLLKHGADINKFYGEYTLISAAIEDSDLKRVRLALSLGADPNVTSDGRRDQQLHVGRLQRLRTWRNGWSLYRAWGRCFETN